MKKWFGILGVIMVLAGCQDSTSDVAVATGPTDAPPDTIMTKDGVTVEFYGPGHDKTEPSAALFASSLEETERQRLEELGYVIDTSEAAVALGRTDDGRFVEVTWFSAQDRFGLESAIVHVSMDGEEEVMTFDGGRSDDSHPEMVKGDSGPERIEARACLDFARSYYQLCLSTCIRSGSISLVCRISCLKSAVFVFIFCFFTSL